MVEAPLKTGMAVGFAVMKSVAAPTAVRGTSPPQPETKEASPAKTAITLRRPTIIAPRIRRDAKLAGILAPVVSRRAPVALTMSGGPGATASRVNRTRCPEPRSPSVSPGRENSIPTWPGLKVGVNVTARPSIARKAPGCTFEIRRAAGSKLTRISPEERPWAPPATSTTSKTSPTARLAVCGLNSTEMGDGGSGGAGSGSGTASGGKSGGGVSPSARPARPRRARAEFLPEAPVREPLPAPRARSPPRLSRRRRLRPVPGNSDLLVGSHGERREVELRHARSADDVRSDGEHDVL